MDSLAFSRAAREHLDREEALLRELIDRLDEERAAICALDGPAVARIAAAKEALADRERELAVARSALIGQAAAMISERSGGSPVDLSLGEIVERLRPSGAQGLLEQRARVRALAREAQYKNAVNRHLCTHALACLRGHLGSAGLAAGPTYGASGRLVPSAAVAAYARRA